MGGKINEISRGGENCDCREPKKLASKLKRKMARKFKKNMGFDSPIKMIEVNKTAGRQIYLLRGFKVKGEKKSLTS
ncbi:hypothetical protein [Neochlamydia sp. AcF95]|uniref:hypothetical protein n=1 Tax=Neochlamydia sp. AcF95 TaxID=2795734 RepID=UPI001BCA4D74|nr:hypothetical protein [Neochlamydia sp. AcF95]